MRIVYFFGVFTLILLSCTTPPEQGAFVTYLGSDTLAVEQFVFRDNRLEADVMLRTPETTLQRYVLELDDAGMMQRYEATILDPASPEAPPLSRDLLLASPEGFTLQRTRDGEENTRVIEADAATLPFLDMIHWPYEIALMRTHDASGDLYEQPLLTGSNARLFEIRHLSPDSMTINHPYRSTMGVTVDDAGRLQVLDASETTRKLRVIRIINTQTGQGGTTHDANLDLGRVPMQLETLDEPVEIFTIDIEERDQGGVLQLKWDRSAFTIPFTVTN